MQADQIDCLKLLEIWDFGLALASLQPAPELKCTIWCVFCFFHIRNITPSRQRELIAGIKVERIKGETMIYAYLRVSTDDQDTANQRMGVEAKARVLDLTIDKYIIDDGISGTKTSLDSIHTISKNLDINFRLNQKNQEYQTIQGRLKIDRTQESQNI